MMQKLRDLAEELGNQHGDPTSSALTYVTTYAAQLDVPGTGEGWQCPDVVVGPDDAAHIRAAYAAGVANEERRR